MSTRTRCRPTTAARSSSTRGSASPGTRSDGSGILEQTGRPERIVITHFHPDHVGGAAIVAGLAEAPVYQGELDYEYCRRAWTAEAAERSEQHMVEHGTPPEEAATVRAPAGAADGIRPLRARSRAARCPGSRSAAGRSSTCRATPTATSRCSVTACSSPATRCWAASRRTSASGPASAPDPLSDYLGSLARIVELDPRLALPGHGERILDPAARAREISEHHDDRLTRTLDTLGPSRGRATTSRARSSRTRSRPRCAASRSRRRSRTSSISCTPAARPAFRTTGEPPTLPPE